MYSVPSFLMFFHNFVLLLAEIISPTPPSAYSTIIIAIKEQQNNTLKQNSSRIDIKKHSPTIFKISAATLPPAIYSPRTSEHFLMEVPFFYLFFFFVMKYAWHTYVRTYERA